MERFNKSLARDAVSAYVGVAEKHGLAATQLAIAWVKSRPFVTSTIIGATSMEQLKVWGLLTRQWRDLISSLCREWMLTQDWSKVAPVLLCICIRSDRRTRASRQKCVTWTDCDHRCQ